MRGMFASMMVLLCGALAIVRPANGLQAQGVRTGTAGLLREEQTVIVNGAPEVWRLEWKSAPKPYCVPEARDESWAVCPCDGFAFGEAGPMDLVRLRNGREIERLSLGQFFPEYDHQVILPKRERREVDIREFLLKDDTSSLVGDIQKRPIVKTLNFADYDHDGQAIEFFIQTEMHSCGHRYGIVLGVSKQNAHLHAFGTVAHTNTPLLLAPWHWEALKKTTTPPPLVETGCGDHGSDSLQELELAATPAGIRSIMRVYECAGALHSQRGRMVEQSVR